MEKERPSRLIRRARLAKLMEDAGGPKELNRLLKKPLDDTYLTSCKTGARNMGDAAANEVERVMHKPFGWLDEDRRAGWPFKGIDRQLFEVLSPDQKTEIQGVVRRMILDFRDGSAPAANESRPGDFIDTAEYKGPDRRDQRGDST